MRRPVPTFLPRLYVAYKETNETEYWLELLYEAGYIEKLPFESIYSDCKELIRLLAAITRSARKRPTH